MTTGKTIGLTRRTFVGKVMSLLFNMLSRLVITFLPRNKHLLISRLQPPSAVILEPQKNKVSHCVHCTTRAAQYQHILNKDVYIYKEGLWGSFQGQELRWKETLRSFWISQGLSHWDTMINDYLFILVVSWAETYSQGCCSEKIQIWSQISG